MRKPYRQSLVIVVVLLLGVGLGWGLNQVDFTARRTADPITVVSPEGDSVSKVAREVTASLVGVLNYSETGDFFTRKTEEKTGSGVVIDRNGLVVTNHHVVQGAQRLMVVLSDGTRKEAEVVGQDARSDLALVQVKGVRKLTSARWGDSSKLVVGQSVVAIGNPLGLGFAQSVTAGIISGLNRVITTQEGFQLKLIQTDAAINPGNSGGPLVNLAGEVIGINTVKIAAPGFEGMGFSIPSNQARAVVEDLRQHGRVKRPVLGVELVREISGEEAGYYRLPIKSGVVVIPVRNGPADKAGVQDYDIIKKVNNQQVKSSAELQEVILSHKLGDEVKLDILRLPRIEGQKTRELIIKVKLGEDTAGQTTTAS
ncbi:MAG: PDZ domain-containing protein [Syntrophomonadaceae bacterium]|nr:PDZ domain-containing protein [Syntrophomonadaceae bacterium]